MSERTGEMLVYHRIKAGLKAMGYSIFIVTEEQHDDIINFLRKRSCGNADCLQGGVMTHTEREGE